MRVVASATFAALLPVSLAAALRCAVRCADAWVAVLRAETLAAAAGAAFAAPLAAPFIAPAAPAVIFALIVFAAVLTAFAGLAGLAETCDFADTDARPPPGDTTARLVTPADLLAVFFPLVVVVFAIAISLARKQPTENFLL
ncbi:hypothetical protein GCM10027419_19000 [Pandoraea terrae]